MDEDSVREADKELDSECDAECELEIVSVGDSERVVEIEVEADSD